MLALHRRRPLYRSGRVRTVIQLRPYQDQCIAGLRGAFSAGYRAPLLVSPVGSGKTVMFSYLAGRLLAAGKRSVIMAHREELLEQISSTLRAFDVRHGMIVAGERYDRRHGVHVASVQTLVRRLDRGIDPPDYVIADEAHHCIGGSSWGKVVAAWSSARLIGVTATPERLSGEGLGQVFDTMVMGPSVRELIDAGALSDYRLFAPRDRLDLSGVRRRGGDFARSEVEVAIDKPAIVGDAVAHYRRLCDGAPAVAFCVSIAHAQHVAESFRAQGYRAASIDGKMPREDRRAIIADFRSGALNVLASCDLISEGFDVPGIVAAILLRPTESLAMYLQQTGRALRTAPGKSQAVILDHVGNSLDRHGLPDDEREWSLEGRAAGGKRKKDSEALCRQCKSCFAISPAYAAICRECGSAFAVKARKLETRDGELGEVDPETVRRQQRREQGRAQTYDALVALGRMRGMRSPEGWARHVLQAREAKARRATG